MANNVKITYGEAIRAAFEYLLNNYPEVFVIGQGLWSPWYVGSSMTELEKQFGKERIIDSPVSEFACNGAALGAATCGMRPIVVHPRIDFMLLGIDSIVTQAAKWRSMFGGKPDVPVTFRAVINRGGEQGAQHSQSLHSWFAHIPGLRVVMPYSVADARDLLIAAVLSNDPVMVIDDRWLYEQEAILLPPGPVSLDDIASRVIVTGNDVTLVGCGHATQICVDAAKLLLEEGISAEVVDLRVLNPIQPAAVVASVKKTGRLCAVDGDWKTCGMASEILAIAAESLAPSQWKSTPSRVTFPDAPAPTNEALERVFFLSAERVAAAVHLQFKGEVIRV